MEKDVAVVVENFDGTFLLHLRDEHAPTMTNHWCLVGGSVNDGESAEEAAVRETKEETNLDLYDLEFFKKFIENSREEYIYYGKVDSRKQEVKLGEGRKLEFFTKEEFRDLIEGLDYTNGYLEVMMEFLQYQPQF